MFKKLNSDSIDKVEAKLVKEWKKMNILEKSI